MDSLKGAADSGGDGYVTKITTDIFPQELRSERNEIIGATQILHFLDLACAVTFLVTCFDGYILSLY